jgi:predicted transcriptional regulator
MTMTRRDRTRIRFALWLARVAERQLARALSPTQRDLVATLRDRGPMTVAQLEEWLP